MNRKLIDGRQSYYKNCKQGILMDGAYNKGYLNAKKERETKMNILIWFWKLPITYPKFVKEYWRKNHNPLIKELKKMCGKPKNILDVGCGSCSPIKYIEAPSKTGIDIWKPSLKTAIKRKTYDKIIQGDALEICKLLPAKSYDLVLCLNLLEHLEKEKGKELIRELKRIGLKVIVLVPLGWFAQGEEGNNPYQEHQSAWLERELIGLGFCVKIIETKRCKQILGNWKTIEAVRKDEQDRRENK